MIALSNEEIAIITNDDYFQRWNFITNTLLNTFGKFTFIQIFNLPERKTILTVNSEGTIKI